MTANGGMANHSLEITLFPRFKRLRVTSVSYLQMIKKTKGRIFEGLSIALSTTYQWRMTSRLRENIYNLLYIYYHIFKKTGERILTIHWIWMRCKLYVRVLANGILLSLPTANRTIKNVKYSQNVVTFYPLNDLNYRPNY